VLCAARPNRFPNVLLQKSSGSGDRCVFSNVRSAILSRTPGRRRSARERWATSPTAALNNGCAAALIEERRRSKKPSPSIVFLRIPEDVERNSHRLCPGLCPWRLCLIKRQPADARPARRCSYLEWRRFSREPPPRSRCPPLSCKCRTPVYLQTRGEVAERLKAAVC
jgi:hypothetical protein